MCSYVQQMAADDDKALLLGNGYKAWSEVHTGLGERLDILLGDASGVQIEMDYENIGMTKVDAQERLGQGIGSLLPALVACPQSQLSKVTRELERYSDKIERNAKVADEARGSYRRGVCEFEDEILSLQATLEDYIPDSIWPDSIMRDPPKAEDPMWTRAENEIPDIPPALSQFERGKPYDLNKYVEYHHLIAAKIDQSRQAAE